MKKKTTTQKSNRQTFTRPWCEIHALFQRNIDIPILFISVPTNLLCTFEFSFCFWTSITNDGLEWKRYSAISSSITKLPEEDHTTKSRRFKYQMIRISPFLHIQIQKMNGKFNISNVGMFSYSYEKSVKICMYVCIRPFILVRTYVSIDFEMSYYVLQFGLRRFISCFFYH